MSKKNQGSSVVLMQNERIADRVLFQDNIDVKSLIENQFDVGLTKNVKRQKLLVEHGEQDDQYNSRIRKSEQPDQEQPKKEDVYKTVATTTITINANLAKNREQAEQVLKEIQAELLKREATRLNDMLNNPRKLDHSKQSTPLSVDMLNQASEFLTELCKAENLKPRDKQTNVRKEMSLIEKENKIRENAIFNTESTKIRKTLSDFNKKQIKKLHPNQTTEVLTTKLIELETLLTKSNLQAADIDSTVISINGHIEKVKTAASLQLNSEKQAKEDLYKKLAQDERIELLAQVEQAVAAKNIPHDAETIEAYAKTALFKLERVTLTPDHIRSICQSVKNDYHSPEPENEKLQTPAIQADPFAENEIERAKTYQSTVLILDKTGKNAKTDGPRLFVPKNDMEALQIENMRKRGLSLIAGPAGTGKTSTTIAFMISEMEAGHIQKMILTTPMFDTGMGAMPGNELQKMGPHVRRLVKPLVKFAGKDRVRNWMGLAKPAQAEPPTILDEILNDNPVQFLPLEVALGLDLPGAAIFVDEAQLMSMDDAYTIATRPGFQSQLIFCGDPRQKSRSKTDRNGQPIRDFDKYPAFEMLLEKAPLYSKMTTVTRYDENHVVRSALAQDMTKLFRQMREDFDAQNGIKPTMSATTGLSNNAQSITKESSFYDADRQAQIVREWDANDDFYLDPSQPVQAQKPLNGNVPR